MEHIFYFEFTISTPVTVNVSIEPRCECCIVAEIEADEHSIGDWNIHRMFLRREALKHAIPDVEIPFGSPLFRQAMGWFVSKETDKVDEAWAASVPPEKLGYGHLRRELL